MPKGAKPILDMRSAARAHTAMCIRTLAHVAASPRCAPAARVVAANSLLDRGWGKPDQVHAGPDGGPIQVIIRQILENVEQSDPLLIEHDPDEA